MDRKKKFFIVNLLFFAFYINLQMHIMCIFCMHVILMTYSIGLDYLTELFERLLF